MKMGDVSNLITDMTIRGTVPDGDEIARAVRHSMVVIDSEKHHLNYKQSYIDNGIAELKKKYQGGEKNGASTLISKSSSEDRRPHREEGMKVLDPETGKTKRMYIDPETGKKLYEYTGQTYTKRTIRKDGTIVEKVIPKTVSSTKMAETDDAFTLSSGTPMETIYATHANKLKALANQARKESIHIEPLRYSPEAKEKYATEVAKLNAELNIALKNAPLERHAQLLANAVVATKREANPDMDAADIKKIKGQALAEMRIRTGAHKQRVEISDKQWEAIQAGAISHSTLLKILNNTDLDRIKELATPRTKTELTPGKEAQAKAMVARGYTQAEVADALGISVGKLAKVIK
jgi:hypothetical protein